jgi:hypothetical protein
MRNSPSRNGPTSVVNVRSWNAARIEQRAFEIIDADPGAGPAVLRLGVLLWSRVYGLVSFELAGAFESMGIDGELMLTSELEAITRNGY